MTTPMIAHTSLIVMMTMRLDNLRGASFSFLILCCLTSSKGKSWNSRQKAFQSQKKRHYDNTKRAAAAEHAKKMRCKTANQSRLPRNSEEAKAMLWYLCVLNLLFFLVCALNSMFGDIVTLVRKDYRSWWKKDANVLQVIAIRSWTWRKSKISWTFLSPERNENKTPSFTCHVRIVLHIVGIQNIQNTISWEPSFGDNALKVYSECRHTEWTR